MNYRIISCQKKIDDRGYLLNFLSGNDMDRKSKLLGQIYFVTFEKPGVVRGNHYHRHKAEWFAVLEGKIKAVFEDIKTKKRKEVVLEGGHDDYKLVFVGKNVAHAFRSISAKAAMINYSDKPYYSHKPDSQLYLLIKS